MKRAGKIPTLENVILLDSGDIKEIKYGEDAGFHLYPLSAIIQTGTKSKATLNDPLPGTCFTLCYTSGTTGDPKGAMLSHYNILTEIAALRKLGIDITSEDWHLSYLPLAHVFERAISMFLLAVGGSIGYFAGDVFKLKDDMIALKPTFFPSVP